MIDHFDHYVMSLMSGWAQHSVFLNKFIVQFLSLYTIKSLPVFAALWLLWFSGDAIKNRQAVLQAFVAMFIAGAVSRVVQDFLPERVRPLHSGDPYFTPPVGLPPEAGALEHWSSFPSDHAAVFFALSTALWLFSRPLGVVSYAWSILIICLPRLFAGYHYASDVIGGAIIGVLAALLAAPWVAAKLAPWVWAAEKRSKGLFYAGFFILSFEVATMFDDVRLAGSALKKLM